MQSIDTSIAIYFSGKFSTKTDDKERDCKIPDLKKTYGTRVCVYFIEYVTQPELS